ncbi:MAG TPA: phosphoenolpyruvate-utilizing N-terminal domain-containing protein, partial [Thermoanaerobaculia bacterium]
MAEMRILEGMGVSGGIAIGRAVCLETRGPEVFRLHIPETQVENEVVRLREGVEHARGELNRLRSRAEEDLGNDLAAIFDAHVLLLSDRHFLGRVEERIRTHHVNAEWAVHKTAEELDDRFAHMDDTYLRERSEDLTDVSRHLLRSLQGIAHHDLSQLPDDIVIVADDLTPSDAVRLGRERVIGFAIESGGRTSHTTIIARSLNIPAVAGLVSMMGLMCDDAPIIVDGETGTVILHPDAPTLQRYLARKAEILRRDRDLLATRELAAVTHDGV